MIYNVTYAESHDTLFTQADGTTHIYNNGGMPLGKLLDRWIANKYARYCLASRSNSARVCGSVTKRTWTYDHFRFLMIYGAGAFYSGLQRRKNALSALSIVLISALVAAIQWMIW